MSSSRGRHGRMAITSLNAGGIDGRIVPDVAALAGLPGYSFVFNGQPTLNGGTSAAAPLWASLIARIRSRQTPRGRRRHFSPPPVPKSNDGCAGRYAFVDITQGNNTSPRPGRGYALDAASTRSPVGACPTGRRCSHPCRRSHAVSCGQRGDQPQVLRPLQRGHRAEFLQHRDRLVQSTRLRPRAGRRSASPPDRSAPARASTDSPES